MKKYILLLAFLCMCVENNPESLPSSDPNPITPSNNKTVSGKVVTAGPAYVAISKITQTFGTITKESVKNSILASTQTTDGFFSLSYTNDWSTLYITAYTEGRNNIPASFACIKLSDFKGILSLSSTSLSKKTKITRISIQTYIFETTINKIDEVFTDNYDNCPDAPFWIPSLKNTSNYFYHLISCGQEAGGDPDITVIDPVVHAIPTVGYRPKGSVPGTIIDEGGNGFHSNCLVTLYFRSPSGIFYSNITKITDANGYFSYFFQVSTGTELGTWTYYAVDAEKASSRIVPVIIKE